MVAGNNHRFVARLLIFVLVFVSRDFEVGSK